MYLQDKKLYGKFADIKDKLEEIKEKDTKHKIFGSEIHNYVNVQVSEDEIFYLEEVDLGVRLPEEFRLFLKEIGYGAGPGHGIFCPDEISQQVNYLKNNDPSYKTNNPFPDRENFSTIMLGGYIPICDMHAQACNHIIHLVVCGSLTGNVWSCINLIEHWYPVDPKPSPTFLQWYEYWLDCCISSIPNLYGNFDNLGKKRKEKRAN